MQTDDAAVLGDLTDSLKKLCCQAGDAILAVYSQGDIQVQEKA